MFSNIQMLRALAAILVMMHHAEPHYRAMGGSFGFIEQIGRWGFTGVDIFFVISGFVIAHTTLTRERTAANAGEFLKHRLLRIYLGYWPFLPLYLLIYQLTTPEKIATLDMFDSIFLTGTDMFKLAVPVAWSLSYEIYFYGLFLLSFLLPISIARKAIGVVFVALLLKTTLAPGAGGEAAAFLFSPYLLEFFAGAIVWMLMQRTANPWLIPVALLGAIFFYKTGIAKGALNGSMRVFCFGSGAVCILVAAVLLEKNNIYRAGRVFTELGNASYTIYLSHLALLTLFYYSHLRDFLAAQPRPVAEAGFLAFLLAMLVASVLVYRYWERPLYRFACSIRIPSRRGSVSRPVSE